MKKLIEALTILSKYIDPNDSYAQEYPTHCEHDILMVPSVKQEVEAADAKRLEELNFFYSEEFNCWASFVFGSC